MKKILKLIISIAIPLLIGFGASFLTSGSIDTRYLTLAKPSFNPPNWIFGPVRTLLYILMGVAFYLVRQKNFNKKKMKNIGIYAIQLILNFSRSLCFFGLQNPGLALINILILWIVIVCNMLIFYKSSKTAGYLLLPYLLRVSFASILNISIFMLN